MSADLSIDRAFLVGILNSGTRNEQLQVLAYNLLNVSGYRPTDEEIAMLVVARLANSTARGLVHV